MRRSCTLRQCFRTASVDAYILLQPAMHRKGRGRLSAPKIGWGSPPPPAPPFPPAARRTWIATLKARAISRMRAYAMHGGPSAPLCHGGAQNAARRLGA